MKFTFLKATLASLVLSVSGLTQAGLMTFDYEGKNFTDFTRSTYFSTNDKLTGSIEIDFVGAGTYSAANSGLFGLTSCSYSVTNSFGALGPGMVTITDGSAWGGYGLEYTLDATANITSWNVSFSEQRPQGSKEACGYHLCRNGAFKSRSNGDNVSLMANRTGYLGWNNTG